MRAHAVTTAAASAIHPYILIYVAVCVCLSLVEVTRPSIQISTRRAALAQGEGIMCVACLGVLPSAEKKVYIWNYLELLFSVSVPA